MEGIYFYWLFWIGWIVTTFLLEKSRNRLAISIVILLLIIFSNKNIIVDDFVVNSSLIIAIIFGFFLLSNRNLRKVLFYLIISLILTSTFVSFKLFQLYDPLWIMFHPTMQVSIILVILLLILVKEQKIRVAIVFITVPQGEFVYSLFLNNFLSEVKVGQLESLDILATTLFISFIWYGFERSVAVLAEYVKQNTMIRTMKR